ncbi:hypothetical protein MEO41_29345, partial [Dolichospermum sp. ST_sed4]|nr:hypothetical protein [Dolichospermum sp. ST_sed4]
MDEKRIFGALPGETAEVSGALVTVSAVEPQGFIPAPEFLVADQNNPLVEYDSTGMIRYVLDANSIPPGVIVY